MFSHILRGGDLKSFIVSLLLTLPIILLSLSLHETAHGFIAWKLGDPTAHHLGRLTLNPIKHLNPLGFLCMMLAGFGWANPVPVNSRNFKKPRRDILLTSLAGPVSNLLLALIFLLLLRFVGYGWLFRIGYPTQFAADMASFFIIFLYYGISMNVTLAIFNLIPIPPLDGSRILFSLLPPSAYFKFAKYERYVTMIFLLLLILGPLSWVLDFCCDGIMKGLFWMVGMRPFLLFFGIV
ncbi:MAG: site-2 protease family protein [Ruminococcaceae bacterium]|nr:site-2 protease family protein [Oscillospiraceae bacterium]